jgi:hypothetical protein
MKIALSSLHTCGEDLMAAGGQLLSVKIALGGFADSPRPGGPGRWR